MSIILTEISVKPDQTLLPAEELYADIERHGRTCYLSWDKMTEGSDEDFIEMIIRRGHESVLEHKSITMRIVCDRGVTHELVRHRIASYSQESTRYCDYKGAVEFIIPVWSTNIDPGTYSWDHDDSHWDTLERKWFHSMSRVAQDYVEFRRLGQSPQQARGVLPNDLKTEIVVTMNLREWRYFFSLRDHKAAHPQMQVVAKMARKILSEQYPILF